PGVFRSPTQELKPFEPPDEVGEAESPTPPSDAVQSARGQLARRVESPRRKSTMKAFAAVGVASMLLAVGAFMRLKKPAPAAPESLLRKVERASAAPVAPTAQKVPADETSSSGLPPPPVLTHAPRPQVSTAYIPGQKAEPGVAPRQKSTPSVEPRKLGSASRTGSATRKDTQEPAREDDSALEFGQRVGSTTTTA